MYFQSAFEYENAWSGRAGARNQMRKEPSVLRDRLSVRGRVFKGISEIYYRRKKKFWNRLDASSFAASYWVNHPQACIPSLLPPLLPPLLHLPPPLPRAPTGLDKDVRQNYEA